MAFPSPASDAPATAAATATATATATTTTTAAATPLLLLLLLLLVLLLPLILYRLLRRGRRARLGPGELGPGDEAVAVGVVRAEDVLSGCACVPVVAHPPPPCVCVFVVRCLRA